MQNVSSAQSSIVVNSGTYTQPIFTTTSAIGQVPPVASVAPVPALATHSHSQPQQHQQHQQHPQSQSNVQSTGSAPSIVVSANTTPAQQVKVVISAHLYDINIYSLATVGYKSMQFTCIRNDERIPIESDTCILRGPNL